MPNKGVTFEQETHNKNLQFFSIAVPIMVALWICLSVFHFTMDSHDFQSMPQNMREEYITSLFFRQDVWHIPISLTHQINTPVPLSLTDTIPFVVIFLKLFNIPYFQYFGIWLLMSYTLYVFFAYRICKDIFQTNHIANLLGTLIFITMPFIWYHPTYVPWLAGQWVILWAYSIYFKKKPYTSPEWFGIVFVSTLIHPYFALVTFFIFIADMIHLYIYNHRISSLKAATYFSYVFTFVFFCLCLIGVFYLPSLLVQHASIHPITFTNHLSSSQYNPSYLNIGLGHTIGFIISIILAGVFSKKLKKYFYYYRALIGSLFFIMFLACLGGIKLSETITITFPLEAIGLHMLPNIFTSGPKFLLPILFLVPIIINAIALRLEKYKTHTGIVFFMMILGILFTNSKPSFHYNFEPFIAFNQQTTKFLEENQYLFWVFLEDVPHRPKNYDHFAYYAYQQNKNINAVPVIRFPSHYYDYHKNLMQRFIAQDFDINTTYIVSKDTFPKKFEQLGSVMEFNNSILFKPYHNIIQGED